MIAKVSVTAVDVIEWLASDECHAYDGARLIGALAAMLDECGLPVQRLVFHLRVPHPTIFGRSIAWAPGEPVAFLDIEHGVERSERIRASPVLHVMSTRDWLVLRMDDRRWTLHDIFVGRGLTELCIAPLLHDVGEGPSSAVTFGTQKPGGYSPADLHLLRRIMPALRGALELKMWRRTTETMLETYIGSDPEKRILSGRVRRGDVETLEAALMFCDMQGFTELSNRLSSERVLEVLNAYFDEVVPAVAQHGGEVLKFMGDGLLAFFRDEAGAGPSCAAALMAARLIGQRLNTLSLPDGAVRAGIGLHYGEVSYGNIGSGKRLDFTVIGRDVNLTSRIQGVCGRTSHRLLLSRRFTELLALPGAVSIGRHDLKGFAEPVELFAWTED